MVTSHDLWWDEHSFAFVARAADIHVCAYNVRKDERKGGITQYHMKTRRFLHKVKFSFIRQEETVLVLVQQQATMTQQQRY